LSFEYRLLKIRFPTPLLSFSHRIATAAHAISTSSAIGFTSSAFQIQPKDKQHHAVSTDVFL
jgi:hypothetical protein